MHSSLIIGTTFCNLGSFVILCFCLDRKMAPEKTLEAYISSILQNRLFIIIITSTAQFGHLLVFQGIL